MTINVYIYKRGYPVSISVPKLEPFYIMFQIKWIFLNSPFFLIAQNNCLLFCRTPPSAPLHQISHQEHQGLPSWWESPNISSSIFFPYPPLVITHTSYFTLCRRLDPGDPDSHQWVQDTQVLAALQAWGCPSWVLVENRSTGTTGTSSQCKVGTMGKEENF